MCKQTVTIAGKEYLLDIEKAKEDGYLSEPSSLFKHDFQPGDVFNHPHGVTNPFLLVQVGWKKDEYQLLGLGCSTNSNLFFHTTHTIEEIRKYLMDKNMIFSRNIQATVYKLVTNNTED